MAIILDLHHHLWLSVFGILGELNATNMFLITVLVSYLYGVSGNILLVFVFLAPVSTFIEIYMVRSTMGFDSLPYIIALFSCKLWMYYGFIKENAILLIIISSIGVVVETTYILIFLVFATNQVRCQTLKELFLCMGGFYLIFVVSWFLLSSEIRVSYVGWISVAASITLFASPINIVLDVLINRSVEFLKIYMSFFLALSAIMWLDYGFMLRDMCIVLSSIFAFLLGFIQSLLYVIYWEPNPIIEENEYVPEHVMNIHMPGMVYPGNSRRNSSGGDIETNSEIT